MRKSSYRSTYATVYVDRITENVRLIKASLKPETKFMAVIKADGYGHGAVEAGKAALAGGATHLAVALVEEAIVLREAGIEAPILLLSPIEEQAISVAIEQDFIFTVFSTELAHHLIAEKKKTKKDIHVHIKVDTGMGRIGVRTKEETLELVRLLQEGGIEPEGIFTHFADADRLSDSSFTYDQYEMFMTVLRYLEEKGIHFPIRHCANSSATLAYPDLQLDMVRVGIAMFGLFPSLEFEGMFPLKPVMEFKTKALYLKEVPEGENISYGLTYTTPSKRVIATMPVGYADGYPRQLSDKGFVSIDNTRVPIVGRVCMDQTMIDVTDLPSVTLGEEITLFGDTLTSAVSSYDVGEWAGTNQYDILCGVGKRVPRVYVTE